jgi:NAD(P)-dependent dehydrogenase (short-subunit alcohol dehydrogenase family)
MSFENKVVLVTGGVTGIGKAAAILFAKKGTRVAVNGLPDIGSEDVEKEIKALGGECVWVPGDVSRPEDAERIIDETVDAYGRLDILVNNAGVVYPGRVDNTPVDVVQKTLDVNIRGVFLVSKYAVLQMRRQGGGTIVHIASVAAIKGVKDRAIYSASKGAVLALTKAMALDYIKENIRVNCVCPGTTLTGALRARIGAAADPAVEERELVSRQPMGRLGSEEEIASAILFAASDDAGYMNGSRVVIDGGMSI